MTKHRVAYVNSENKAPDWATLRIGDPDLIIFTEGAATKAIDGYRRIGHADAVAYVREGCMVENVVRLKMSESWDWNRPNRPPREYLAMTVDGIDYLFVHVPPIRGDRPNTKARNETFDRCEEYALTGRRRFGPFVLLGDTNIRDDAKARAFGARFHATAHAETGAVDRAYGRDATVTAKRYDGKGGRPDYHGPGHGAGLFTITTTE